MRRLLFFGLALALCATPVFAQGGASTVINYQNGGEYFFLNGGAIPTNASTWSRTLGSASQFASEMSPLGFEFNIHSQAVQVDGFRIVNGQAGPAGVPLPFGFSRMWFKYGIPAALGGFPQAIGYFAWSMGTWTASLPCKANIFYLVTFSWGDGWTPLPMSSAYMHFYSHYRGEVNQAVNNQNYFTGSGNEKLVNNSGAGFSFIEDTIAGTSGQIVSWAEWDDNLYIEDAVTTWGRGPSATPTIDYGNAGKALYTLSSHPIADNGALRVRCVDEAGTGNTVTITLLSLKELGGFVGYDAGPVVVSGDGRVFDFAPDPVLFNLGLSLSIVLQTGIGITAGDIGVTGTAYTLTTPYSFLLPPFLPMANIIYQTIGIKGFFSVMSNVDTLTVY